MISLHKYRPARLSAGACVALGAYTLVVSLLGLRSTGQLDARLLLLAFLALSLGNAIYVKVPRAKAYVAASDALVFLSFLHFGHEAAVPLAAGDSRPEIMMNDRVKTSRPVPARTDMKL
jgi:hypothetical protein